MLVAQTVWQRFICTAVIRFEEILRNTLCFYLNPFFPFLVMNKKMILIKGMLKSVPSESSIFLES